MRNGREWVTLTPEGTARLLARTHEDDRSRLMSEWQSAERCGRFSSVLKVRTPEGRVARVEVVLTRQETLAGRTRWQGVVAPVNEDTDHVCVAAICYCGMRR